MRSPAPGEAWLALALALAGALGLAAALWVTPELAARHGAFEQPSADRVARLEALRALAGVAGVAALGLSLRARWLLAMLPRASRASALPVGTMAALLGGFAALFVANLGLRAAGVVDDTAKLFPVSVVRGPELHAAGLPAAALFAGLLLAALRGRARLGAGGLWAVALGLLLLGNLAQGGVEAGLLAPFIDPRGGPPPGIQYAHEALRIGDAGAWLATFNQRQPELLTHSRTHPPFAVLLHHVLLGGSRAGLPRLALAFPLLASLSVPLVFDLLRRLGTGRERAAGLALLFAVLPAVNVYGASSLDGVILTTSTLCLWGWLRTSRSPSVPGIAACISGLVLTNALSFGGLFLVAVIGLLALRQAAAERRWLGAGVWLGALAVGVALGALLEAGFGYDHAAAFLTASRLENPHGFRGLADPANYAMTRIEGVAEIALFFSLPALAVWLVARRPSPRAPDEGDRVAATCCGVLVAMLLAGAWWTGETARACLFVYPALLLGLRRVPPTTLRSLVLGAGVQTLAMQCFANFFW